MRPPVTAGRPDPGAQVETEASGRWSRPELRNTRADTSESQRQTQSRFNMGENNHALVNHNYDIQLGLGKKK